MFGVILILIIATIAIATLSIFKSLVRNKDGYILGGNVKKIILTILAMVVALGFVSGIGSVPTGNRGIVLRFNATTGKVLGQGIYYVFPFIENVALISVQTKAHETEAASASKDLQDVTTKITLNYSVDPKAAATLYTQVGLSYEKIIIDPAVQEAIKAATAQFNAEELIQNRPLIKEAATNILRNRLITHEILVDAVSLTDFSFSPEFAAAVEKKATATQNALTEENNLKVVKYQADQRIEQARGEAEAIKIQATAINAQGGKDYVTLQAIEKWNGSVPQMVMGSGTIPFLNMPMLSK